MIRNLLRGTAVMLVLAAIATTARAQQMPDTTFRPVMTNPAFPLRHPRVLFDEAHHNFHTSTGRYLPFARLVRADGFHVIPNLKRLSQPERLSGYDILVIANALGPGVHGDSASHPAFTVQECQTIEQWVRDGGALLLIADHAPFGASAEILSMKFGVSMSKGYTVDSLHADTEMRNPGVLVYSRENGTLMDHPITLGRDSSERVNRVIAFTGQSLSVPRGSTAFMKLSDSALDLPVGMEQWQGMGEASLPPGRPAGGRAQGVAFHHGKGRVVILGEAAMLSAQILVLPASDGASAEPIRMGMNRPGIDNAQLTLNLMRWLAGLLE
jgi:hypothetical protein